MSKNTLIAYLLLHMKYRVLLFLLLCSPLLSFALSGKDHAADMKRVFPFEDVEQNSKVFRFYRLVNHYLDWPGQDPKQRYDKSAPHRPLSIANHPKFGNITWSGKHRIWFHWGFNTDPHKFPPIVNSLNDAVAAGVISSSDLLEFWSLLMKEVSSRNRALMNDGAKVFGFGELGTISAAQRRQLNGLITVLYSVHVIGDHETADVDGIAPLSRVYADINNAIDNIAGKDASNMEKAKSIKAALKKAQSSPEKYLNTLEREFTPFILSLRGDGYDYKTRFKKLGYVMKKVK